VLAEQKVPHHKPAKVCRFSELSVWVSGLDSNCRDVKCKGASRKTQICRLHDISAKAEIACLPAFPDDPEKLRRLKTTEFSVVSYFLTKRGRRTTKRKGDRAQMNTELPTAGRSRFVASDRTARPWTTFAPISSRRLNHYRFRLPNAIRPIKVPQSRCQGWRSLRWPRVEEFEVATGV